MAEQNHLHSQLRTEQSNLITFQAETARLQTNYTTGMARIQQLEQELSDILHYKQHILEHTQVAESLASGGHSKMGQINFTRHGELEGRFLERIQSRVAEKHREQSNVVEGIKENILEIKRKTQLVEDMIEDERRYVMQVDGLISSNQSIIQQKKVRIAELEGSIRFLT